MLLVEGIYTPASGIDYHYKLMGNDESSLLTGFIYAKGDSDCKAISYAAGFLKEPMLAFINFDDQKLFWLNLQMDTGICSNCWPSMPLSDLVTGPIVSVKNSSIATGYIYEDCLFDEFRSFARKSTDANKVLMGELSTLKCIISEA